MTSSSDFVKTVRLGTVLIGKSRASVYAKIKFEDGVLSISGVEGPTRGGNARGGCGQIVMSMDDAYIAGLDCAPGWNHRMVRRFIDAWDKWHLNDMRAGTPAQTALIEARKAEFPGYPVSYYTWACGLLEAEGLLIDAGYKYGSAWLREEVPADVVGFLRGLPDADKAPAWA